MGGVITFFMKLGIGIGVLLAVITVWYASSYEKEIKQYHQSHKTYDPAPGAHERGVLTRINYSGRSSPKAAMLDYGAWYRSLDMPEKGAWLVLGCPAVGCCFSIFILLFLLNTAWAIFRRMFGI